LFLPNPSRICLPPPRPDAFIRIIFGLLGRVADDEYATLARSVDLRAVAPRFVTMPLQDMQLRLRVLFVNGLRDRLPVFIPQVGVRALQTEPREFLVDHVDHTALIGQNFFVAVDCPLEILVVEFLTGLRSPLRSVREISA
jgi:hypothetical protein